MASAYEDELHQLELDHEGQAVGATNVGHDQGDVNDHDD